MRYWPRVFDDNNYHTCNMPHSNDATVLQYFQYFDYQSEGQENLGKGVACTIFHYWLITDDGTFQRRGGDQAPHDVFVDMVLLFILE